MYGPAGLRARLTLGRSWLSDLGLPAGRARAVPPERLRPDDVDRAALSRVVPAIPYKRGVSLVMRLADTVDHGATCSRRRRRLRAGERRERAARGRVGSAAPCRAVRRGHVV